MNIRLEAVGAPVSTWRTYLELTKPRLSLLVLTTTAAGFLLAAPAGNGIRLFWTVLGTILVVGGANTMNQVYEREVDALMRRTKGRPLPSGRLWAGPAAAFGGTIGVLGMLVLALGANVLAAALGAIGFGLYAFVYTPMKRMSLHCTLVGAVPGAIPPVIGWAAATGRLDSVAAVLFAILVLWQMPHFLAIARLFREDYSRAGMIMLGIDDHSAPAAYRHMVAYCAALIPASAMLTWLGITGTVYLVGAAALGSGFLVAAVRAWWLPSRRRDRAAFLYSLAYLPLLLLLMLIDRSTA